MPSQHQAFCFTHNNYTQDDVDYYKEQFDKGYFRYMVFGEEIAPSTGTPHLQGFVWTNSPTSLTNIKRKFRNWAGIPGKDKGPDHWEWYCQKEDVDAFESGVRPTQEEFLAQLPKGQGKRSDLLGVKRKIDDGATYAELMEDDECFVVLVQHKKFFLEYMSFKRRRKGFCPPIVKWIHGPSGTMKSRQVHEAWDYDESKLYKVTPAMLSGDTKWFDGYHGQQAVLIEEFRPGTMKYAEVLDLLDGYPTQVQVKGGTTHWSPKYIYVTSPHRPEECFSNLAANDNINQLLRRITEFKNTAP